MIRFLGYISRPCTVASASLALVVWQKKKYTASSYPSAHMILFLWIHFYTRMWVCVWFNITTLVYFKYSWQIRLCLIVCDSLRHLWGASVTHPHPWVINTRLECSSVTLPLSFSFSFSSLKANCHDDHVWKNVSCLLFHFFFIFFSHFSLKIKW